MNLIKTGRILLLLVLALAAAAAIPLSAYAGVPYWTNSKEKQGRLIWTQPAYTPVGLFGKDLTIPDKNKPGTTKPSPLQNPKDLFVDKRDHVYVADTGNNRIVEFDGNGNWIRYIDVPESPLNKPEGVFVTDSQDIYVADTGNKRVVRLSKEGKLVKEFKRPDSKFIPESFKYDPTRLVVDKRGFLYIAVLGGYQGLLQLDPEGKFQSFYGANATVFSPLDALKRALYTKEMYANEISKLPGAISSVAVDKDGFLYTTTGGQGIKKNQIKKLSIRGLNMLDTPTDSFGETRPFDVKFATGGTVTPQLIDIAVDGNGNITAIDSSYKYINQYDANGNLLFFWAGPSSANTTQLGLMKNPVAVDAGSRNDLYLLDGQEGVVQIFRLSEFGIKVNEANKLTLAGRYEESEKHWREVLRLNANFTPAMLGLAKAAYKQGDYEEALRLFKRADDQKGYSDSFWQIRLKWFQSHFSTLATAALIAVVGFAAAERWTRGSRWRSAWRNRRRSSNPFVVQFKHVFYMLKHPIDGFSALRYENKGGYWSAIVILVGAYAALVVMRLFTSFSFNLVNAHRVNLLSLLLQYGLIWIGWVVSNYLVSSIYRGEGRFKDVFVGSAYALVPVIVLGVPLAVLSNVMTASEQAIYDFIQTMLYVWTALMVFWKIQSLQNYSVGETIVNIVLSLFAFLMLAVLVLVVLGLSGDLKDFLFEVYQEVRLR
ncbi:YIP1 family protein [Paenibacillus flagellatus]|uniref:Nuclease PIN n=1 Tax=Paenibacillus flagellatus TaxID=2211139 RepID=A0A2V5KE62_9BACL|nr:YIP1 family protein [Paenibacillus flagellatus]PYI56343.1 nuclease PIN [Paenibacillus flagellatus]